MQSKISMRTHPVKVVIIKEVLKTAFWWDYVEKGTVMHHW
jgi:hypothetical protein